MRGEHDVGTEGGNFGTYFFYRRRRKRGLEAVFLPCGQHFGFRCDAALFEDLRPAVAEKAVAHNQAFFAACELARHRLHAGRAGAGNDGGMLCAVNFFQGGGDVTQGRLKFLRHVVQRAVGINHGIFEQAVGIDFGTGERGYCLHDFFLWCRWDFYVRRVRRKTSNRCGVVRLSFRFKANPL